MEEGIDDSKRVLFVFMAAWRRPLDLKVRRKREYDLMRSRVGSESGLVVWSLDVGPEVYYEGVFVLREKLVMIGELREWFGEGVEVCEPVKGETVEEFLVDAPEHDVSFNQSKWEQHGDEETLAMLRGVSKQIAAGNRAAASGSLGRGPFFSSLRSPATDRTQQRNNGERKGAGHGSR
jgi:hypothetical protein